MAKETITFRLDPDTKHRLDALAQATRRDRSEVLNAAVEAYLDLNAWQLGQLTQSLQQADNQTLASADKVAKAIQRWRR